MLASCSLWSQDIGERFENAMGDMQSISFDTKYYIKFFDDSDTTFANGHVEIWRDAEDEHFGILAWVQQDSVQVLYKRGTVYHISLRFDKVVEYNWEENEGGALDSYQSKSLMGNFFQKYTSITGFMTDSSITATVDESNNKINLQLVYADESPVTNMRGTIQLDAQSLLVEKRSFQVQFYDQWQYNGWKFKNYRINHQPLESGLNKIDSIISHYSEDYDYEVYASKERVAPHAEGDTIEVHWPTTAYSGKKGWFDVAPSRVAVFDLYYESCYPCQMQFVALDSLVPHYESRGVTFLGVDTYDKCASAEDTARITNFFSQRDVEHFPVAYVDDFNLKAMGYPTTVIVVDGVVRYYHTGYGPGIERHFAEVLDEILREGDESENPSMNKSDSHLGPQE